MNSSLEKFSTIKSLKVQQQTMNFRAKEIFMKFCNFLNPGANTIKSAEFYDLILLFKIEMVTDSTIDLIEEYLIENLKKNNNHPFDINQEDFCNFISGMNLKYLLFDYSIDERRKNVETITKLYTLLGGNEEGINEEKIRLKMNTFMEFIMDPNGYIDNENANDREYCKKETENLLKMLSTKNGNTISLQDFINIITNETFTDFEKFSLETS
jgi:hypothetical protein